MLSPSKLIIINRELKIYPKRGRQNSIIKVNTSIIYFELKKQPNRTLIEA